MLLKKNHIIQILHKIEIWHKKHDIKLLTSLAGLNSSGNEANKDSPTYKTYPS
jgi:hypothetical protein